MKLLFVILFCLFTVSGYSQQLPSVQILEDSINSSFRGLSVPSDEVVWVSGSNGTVGRSTDAGTTWKWMTVPGFEKRDFRDIEAFDSLTAIIMAVDNPADILKTMDGGKNWKVVFHKEEEGMFLDAMDFVGEKGLCIGDPVALTDSTKKQIFILETTDAGNTWYYLLNTPVAVSGESIFAGSGTNIWRMNHPSNAYRKYSFITGGMASQIIVIQQGRKLEQQVELIPLMKGKNSTGPFSMFTNRNKKFYVTGGDYAEYWKDSANVVYSTNAGKTWKQSSVHGYRSCIIQVSKKTFITCGTNGVDISFNSCKTWQLIHGDGAKGKDGFNVCAKSKTGKAVYFAGTGRIGKLI